ncbi:aliphatic sulfonate ABC transporter substrate-binding protein [Clostridium fermenticellae]|uniref:Aliphatic sulfonate ABC transporter substrate-binding protein n=1 Tax=Clostridium fermenticellae TaxID=2068654 RepID=A0A386H1K3_9CLOT|nr:aliphatic sulfonate ABC transporter substrate-binding protein [Clostridium fermenticellae]AYD39550.1 aliphatic sulfonate ABC transporter substrate-binding protein [Clostridium fermenticellae]
MNFKKILANVVIVTVTAALFSGCTASKKSTASEQSNGTSSNLPKVVNIGTQQMPNDEKIAITKDYFEKELGVKVKITEFQAGDIRNALVSKDIDFALLGSASATQGIASGIDIETIWIHEVLGDAEQLVVKKNSNINSIQDLKGKKVATPFTTTTHYSLLKALAINGMSEKDVKLLDMQMPDIYAAWQRGDIDAAYAWEPTLSNLLEDGRSIISSKDMASKGFATYNVEVVRREFADKYPDLVTKYVKAVNKAVNLYDENQADAIKMLSVSLKITPQEALKETKGSMWLSAKQQLDPAYFGTSDKKGNLVKSLKDTADFLYKQKKIKTEPSLTTFEKAVNPSFIEKAVK